MDVQGAVDDEEWFGAKLKEKEAWLAKGRAYACNVQSTARKIGKMNSSSLHFLFELLQNANDCRYAEKERPTLTLDFDAGSGLLFVHKNEVGFDRRDVLSITGLGDSTKNACTEKTGCNDCSGRPTRGTERLVDGALVYVDDFEEPAGHGTGNKGVGFKSFVEECEFVCVFSNAFRFRINRELPLLPEIMTATEMRTMLPPAAGKVGNSMQVSGSIIVGKTDAKFDKFERLLEPCDIRFLKKLEKVVMQGQVFERTQDGLLRQIKVNGEAVVTFLRVKFCVPCSASNATWSSDSKFFEKKTHTTVTMDFDLMPLSAPAGKWFATLPMNGIAIPIPFHFNADFVTTTTREGFAGIGNTADGAWNKNVLQQIYFGILLAYEKFKRLPDNEDALVLFTQFIPLPIKTARAADDAAAAEFNRICSKICAHFRGLNFVPSTKSGHFVSPSQVRLLENKESQAVFGGDDNKLHSLFALTKGERSLLRLAPSHLARDVLLHLGATYLSTQEKIELVKHISAGKPASEDWCTSVESLLMLTADSGHCRSLSDSCFIWCQSCKQAVSPSRVRSHSATWPLAHSAIREKAGFCVLFRSAYLESLGVSALSASDIFRFISNNNQQATVPVEMYEFLNARAYDYASTVVIKSQALLSWVPVGRGYACPTHVFSSIPQMVLSVFPHLSKVCVGPAFQKYESLWRVADCKEFSAQDLAHAFVTHRPKDLEDFYRVLGSQFWNFDVFQDVTCLEEEGTGRLIAPKDAVISTGLLQGFVPSLSKKFAKVPRDWQGLFRKNLAMKYDVEFLLMEDAQLERLILSMPIGSLNDFYQVLAREGALAAPIRRAKIFRARGQLYLAHQVITTFESATASLVSALPSNVVLADGDPNVLKSQTLGVTVKTLPELCDLIAGDLSKDTLADRHKAQVRFLMEVGESITDSDCSIHLRCKLCGKVHSVLHMYVPSLKKDLEAMLLKACIVDVGFYGFSNADESSFTAIFGVGNEVSESQVWSLSKLSLHALKFLSSKPAPSRMTKTSKHSSKDFQVETVENSFVTPSSKFHVVDLKAFEPFRATIAGKFLLHVNCTVSEYVSDVTDIQKVVSISVLQNAFERSEVHSMSDFLSWLTLFERIRSGGGGVGGGGNIDVFFKDSLISAWQCAWDTPFAPSVSRFRLCDTYNERFKDVLENVFGVRDSSDACDEVLDEWTSRGTDNLTDADLKNIGTLFQHMHFKRLKPKLILGEADGKLQWIKPNHELVFFADISRMRKPFLRTELIFAELLDTDMAKTFGVKMISDDVKKECSYKTGVEDPSFIGIQLLHRVAPFVRMRANGKTFPPPCTVIHKVCSVQLVVLVGSKEIKSKPSKESVFWDSKAERLVLSSKASDLGSHLSKCVSEVFFQPSERDTAELMLGKAFRSLDKAVDECRNAFEEHRWTLPEEYRLLMRQKYEEGDDDDDEDDGEDNGEGEEEDRDVDEKTKDEDRQQSSQFPSVHRRTVFSAATVNDEKTTAAVGSAQSTPVMKTPVVTRTRLVAEPPVTIVSDEEGSYVGDHDFEETEGDTTFNASLLDSPFDLFCPKSSSTISSVRKRMEPAGDARTEEEVSQSEGIRNNSFVQRGSSDAGSSNGTPSFAQQSPLSFRPSPSRSAGNWLGAGPGPSVFSGKCERIVFERLKNLDFFVAITGEEQFTEPFTVQDLGRNSFALSDVAICTFTDGTADIEIAFGERRRVVYVEVKSSLNDEGFHVSPNQWALAKREEAGGNFVLVYVTMANRIAPRMRVIHNLVHLVESKDRTQSDPNQLSSACFGVTYERKGQ